MASLLSILCTASIIVLAIMCTTLVEGAREFKVGGDLGWHEPVPNDTAFYNQWAARNRFQVDDSLVFVYKNDSVLSVEKWDYFHCGSNNPINTFDDGNSTVILDSPGAFYFISGIEDHCHKGQKLIVEVMSPHSVPNSPPPISIPPQGSSAFAPYSPSHSSSSMALGSAFMVLFTTFVIVLLLASRTFHVGVFWILICLGIN